MGAITTLVVTVAATAGAVALYRFADRSTRELRGAFNEAKKRASGQGDRNVIDYERDPVSGVYKPKE